LPKRQINTKKSAKGIQPKITGRKFIRSGVNGQRAKNRKTNGRKKGLGVYRNTFISAFNEH
jgi:hypothetical protein